MNYYIDTEFHEYHKQQKVCGIKIGKPIPTIDLISIEIVNEDGKTYYAISKDFNIKDAWNSYQMETDQKGTRAVYWLRDNVLNSIWKELHKEYFDDIMLEYAKDEERFWDIYKFTYRSFKYLINKYGKTNKQIAKEINEFVYREYFKDNKGTPIQPESNNQWLNNSKPEFYSYYSAYDWVVFCQLFGKMNNLPKGFPMYCKDLKQELDTAIDVEYDENGMGKAHILSTFKDLPNYPKQTNKHNALADAKWNKELHKFIKTL